MNKVEIGSIELRELQDVVDNRQQLTSSNFVKTAEMGMDRLWYEYGGLAKSFSVGFLLRPSGVISQEYTSPVSIARVDERGVLMPDHRITNIKNKYHDLAGFNCFNTANGWLAGIVFDSDDRRLNTIIVPHSQKIELFAHGRLDEDTIIDLRVPEEIRT